jgi:hypothetical protein
MFISLEGVHRMTVRQILAVAAALAMIACTRGHAELHQFVQDGTLKIDAGSERSAMLHVNCSPDSDGGALSIELVATDANTRKDFDYDDFEGPDAAGGGKALSHIAWTSATGTTQIVHAAAGWYAPEPPQSFMFGISQMSHHREEPARLLNAIRDEPGTLVWTQTGFDNAKHQLVARFELDVAAVKRLHDTAAVCLPQNLPTKKPM